VAAVDRRTALEALSLIDVAYEVLPAVYTIEDALASGAPRLHDVYPITSMYTSSLTWEMLKKASPTPISSGRYLYRPEILIPGGTLRGGSPVRPRGKP